MSDDIRWQQRLKSYEKAFNKLNRGIELSTQRELTHLEKEGIIQRFQYTQELSWKVIKDFYEFMGETSIQGSRDAFRLASTRGLITDGIGLMNTIKSRNLASHTYNENTADEIFTSISEEFITIFKELLTNLIKEQKSRDL